MRILAIHNVGFEKTDKESAVQIWRIWRPLEELKKHVDWTIDYQKTFIKDIGKYKDLKEFTTEEVEKAGKHLGSYDIVFASYHVDAAAHSLMMAVSKIYGTKFILDDDDNTFAIDPENPFWANMSHDHAFIMQRIARTAPYICTTTEALKRVFEPRSEVNAKVFVIPNYIADSYQSPTPNNGDNLVIGFFGGSAHYIDFERTGILPALQKVMFEHPNVHVKTIGIPIDYYLPKKRYHLEDVMYGRKFITDLFPTMQFDIGIAPLRNTVFAEGKSNIKWQEYTRMGALFVGSDVGPYKGIKNGILVDNTEKSWYEGLKKAVEDEDFRKKTVKAAQKELAANWRLEDEKNWSKYRQLFEEVYNDGRTI